MKPETVPGAGGGVAGPEVSGIRLRREAWFYLFDYFKCIFFYGPGWLPGGVRAVPVWGLRRGHPGDAPKAFSSFAGQG